LSYFSETRCSST